jgi:DNA polymerase (family 10)
MQNHDEVARSLDEIAGMLAFAGAPRFRSKAYERAAVIVRTVGAELATLIEQARLRELEGIGPTLTRQIEELWHTGRSDYLERLRREHPEGAAELVQVEGMTPRRIRALQAALGVRSAAELQAACKAERVRTVAGFGAKTEARLLEASERWLARGGPAPRRLLLAEASELGELLRRELLAVVPEVHLAGAVRRGEEVVDELEIVVVGDRARALQRLRELRQVWRLDEERGVAQLSAGATLKLRRAGDDAGTQLLEATGTEAHVAAVRDRLGARGVTGATFASERELYAAIGVAFVPPELRSGGDELALAERGDFADLLELGHIAGAVHCHTEYSDGKSSVLEMAAAAHARGLKYITITDHSPSAHYAGGVTLDRLERQWDEIAAAEEQVPIRILRGTESDILADGQLDYPDAVLERFDIVIASIHARHRQDRSAMTERLVRAMSLPLFKIWGHGLGRILEHRPPIDCDVPRVLDALARAGGAVEINADPHRLDLPPAWIPAARERNIPFVISADAHSTRGLDVVRYGVTMARRGGVRRSEVLNTLPPEEFLQRVRPVRRAS